MPIPKHFLTKTEDTGRFIIHSIRTGKTYGVEPLGSTRTGWGDIDPATKTVNTGEYGVKYKGSVNEKESLITEDNGFVNITTLPPGTSPLAYIDMIDEKYPDFDLN